MLRRWFLFGLALMMLTLCLAAWGVSYWRYVVVAHEGKTILNFELNAGRVLIAWKNRPEIPGGWWRLAHGEAAPWDDHLSPFHWLGFCCGSSFLSYFTIPLWFPSVLSLVFLWFAWRKTRRKPAGKAFPIEPAGTDSKEATTGINHK